MNQVNNPTSWPPQYQLRKSKRARRVNFKISIKHGLQVTVPWQFDEAELPALLEHQKQWIIKHLNQIQPQRQLCEQATLPNEIDLAAINEQWSVEYYDSIGKCRLITRPHQQLVIMGDIRQQSACKKLLIEWLKNKAQCVFQAWLTNLSQRTDLHFNKLTIRAQQTRWGSCSSEKNINLNYKLLFLSAELAEHVLLHELCHTRYMSHGKRFWQLLAEHDPQSEVHDQALAQADVGLPLWLDRKFTDMMH